MHAQASLPIDVLRRNHVSVLGHGPTLVYAHGFGCSLEMWSYITPAFAGSHRQVLFDYVGSGRADPSAFDPARYGSLKGYARDLVEVCDAVGIQGATLVAHSVSCSIGMLAAIDRPDLFDRLVLVGPSPCFLNHPPDYHGGFEPSDLEGLLALMDENHLGFARYLAPIVAGASGGALVTKVLSDRFCASDPRMARVFARATFFDDVRAAIPRVPCPALILQHESDVLAPVGVGEYLHARMAGSTLKILPVAGHSAHLSDPSLVIDAMRSCLFE